MPSQKLRCNGLDSLALSAAMYESQRSLGEFYRCVKGREYEVLDEIKRRYRVELEEFITTNHLLENHIRGELDTNLHFEKRSSSEPSSGFHLKTIASPNASWDDKPKSLSKKGDPTVLDENQAGSDEPTKSKSAPETEPKKGKGRRITFVDEKTSPSQTGSKGLSEKGDPTVLDESQAGPDEPTKREKGKGRQVESIDQGTSSFQAGPKTEISEVLTHYIEKLRNILELEKFAKEVIKDIKKMQGRLV